MIFTSYCICYLITFYFSFFPCKIVLIAFQCPCRKFNLCYFYIIRHCTCYCISRSCYIANLDIAYLWRLIGWQYCVRRYCICCHVSFIIICIYVRTVCSAFIVMIFTSYCICYLITFYFSFFPCKIVLIAFQCPCRKFNLCYFYIIRHCTCYCISRSCYIANLDIAYLWWLFFRGTYIITHIYNRNTIFLNISIIIIKIIYST